MKFHHCWLTPEKCVWPPPGPNPLLPPLEKSLRRPCSFVYRSGLLKLFANVSLSIKCTVSRHLIYADVYNYTNKTIFFSCQSVKSFWTRSQMFLDVGADLQPKPLDVWSWSYSASLKFEFRICSPTLGYCNLRHGTCIC